MKFTQCVDSDSFYACINDVYHIIYLDELDGLVSIGYRDATYPPRWIEYKSTYIVEYKSDILPFTIMEWRNTLIAQKDISVELMDLDGFIYAYKPILKSYGLGTSYTFTTKLINNALRTLSK